MDDKDGFSDIVIFPADIKLSEEFGIFEFINEVRDKREGIGIMDCMFIQVVIVLAGANPSILCLDKEEKRCLGEVQGMDLPTIQVLLERVFSSLGERGYTFPILGVKELLRLIMWS